MDLVRFPKIAEIAKTRKEDGGGGIFCLSIDLKWDGSKFFYFPMDRKFNFFLYSRK